MTNPELVSKRVGRPKRVVNVAARKRLITPTVPPLDPEITNVANALMSPDLFGEVFLQMQLWETQAEILRAVATEPRVVVKACHASSKTCTASIAALWFLARFDESVVVTTAPTWNQVERILWGEIHSALIRSRYPFPNATQTQLRLGPKRYAYGLSTSVTKQDEGVKFQGIHAKNVLIIMDEAPGVDPKIWEAIEGARAGGNVRVLAIGNPTIGSGPFYEAFTTNREGWKTFSINAFNTPNLKGLTIGDGKKTDLLKMSNAELDNNPLPFLTTRRWVKERYIEWGEGDFRWESRVLGDFPKQSEKALYSLSWLEQARDSDKQGDGRFTAGIDVAGPGKDESTLCIRRGCEVVLQRSWPNADARGAIVAELIPYRNKLDAVNVDALGLGWYMYQHLLDCNFPAIPINITETSNDSEKYHMRKAEFYWGLRMRLAAGDVSGLRDEKTIAQLASIQYTLNSRGQIEIESKDKMEKRGVKSPDRAEALILAYAECKRIYGANEYFKQREMEEKFAASTLMKPIMGDNALYCPECNATCVSRGGGGWRCNQCGHQFTTPGDTPHKNPVGINRNDLAKIQGEGVLKVFR